MRQFLSKVRPHLQTVSERSRRAAPQTPRTPRLRHGPENVGRAACASAGGSRRRRLQDLEDGAGRILEHGEPADLGQVHAGHQRRAAELLRLRDGFVAVGNGEDRAPVRRHVPHVLVELEDAGDAAAVDVDHVVRRAPVGARERLHLDPEDGLVERTGRRRITCLALVPVHRPGVVRELGADVLAGLPDAEGRAGRDPVRSSSGRRRRRRTDPPARCRPPRGSSRRWRRRRRSRCRSSSGTGSPPAAAGCPPRRSCRSSVNIV